MIINGKKIAEKIKEKTKKAIAHSPQQPGLAVILIGNNPASQIYVRLKRKACEYVGIKFSLSKFDVQTPQPQILDLIKVLNQDQTIDGILVQLPLPAKFDTNKIISQISPQKDVDGFHPQNVKLFLQNKPFIIPGLAESVIRMIEATKENITEKNALIISNNKIFAKPIIKILSNNQCRAKWISAGSPKLKQNSLKADIIIVAAGIPFLITEKMVKKNAIIIDVGINKTGAGKIVGDVDYQNVKKIAGHISPVPGGVGPMTIAMLLKNTFELSQKHLK